MKQIKDLGYSADQVCTFLHKMEHVEEVSPYVFSYYDLNIKISPNLTTTQSSIKIPRAYMEIAGPSEQQDEFYKIFLLNHMTMGG